MRTPRGLERILLFTDAVVAIAITLLVLPLVDLVPEIRGASVGTLLSDHGDQLGAFALSFVVIARLWLTQHRIFERVAVYDTTLVRLTLVWLFTVVFLPFPTELLATGNGDGASALYIGTLLASSLALGATGAWVDSHPDLQVADASGAESDESHWTTPVLFAAALVITVLIPSLGVWPLLLLLLSGPIDAIRRRH